MKDLQNEELSIEASKKNEDLKMQVTDEKNQKQDIQEKNKVNS